MGDILADIADVAAELADARQHTERVRIGWTATRNPIFTAHTTIQPGLLAQLYESVIPGSSGDSGSRSHPASRPPLALEALSAYTVITLAVMQWCWTKRIEQRDTVEGNVRALVGLSPSLEDTERRRLLADLRRWRTMCAVMTGWEQVTRLDGIACPVVGCEQIGTLRVNLTQKRAYCTSQITDDQGLLVCGATWMDEQLNVLANYIKTTTEGAAA